MCLLTQAWGCQGSGAVCYDDEAIEPLDGYPCVWAVATPANQPFGILPVSGSYPGTDKMDFVLTGATVRVDHINVIYNGRSTHAGSAVVRLYDVMVLTGVRMDMDSTPLKCIWT